MSFANYFSDETTYLRRLGMEFARDMPELARSFEYPRANPDVERLLDGVAFLTARIRQKLDDEVPELTHTLLGMLYPHYLRAIPAMSIVEYRPQLGDVEDLRTIPRWDTVIRSKPIDGDRCQFRTCFGVTLRPLQLGDARLEQPDARTTIVVLPFSRLGKVDLAGLDLGSLRVHIACGDEEKDRLLLAALTRHRPRGDDRSGLPYLHLAEIAWHTSDRQAKHPLGLDALSAVGLDAEPRDEHDERATHLLPYPNRSFIGYRVLQEYFALPAKFHFFDLRLTDEIGSLLRPGKGVESFEVRLHIRDLPTNFRLVANRPFRLHCTPVINLFRHDADPINLDDSLTEYLVRPHCENLNHFEVWAIDESTNARPGPQGPRTSQPRRGVRLSRSRIRPFYSFEIPEDGSAPDAFYETRLRATTRAERGTDMFLRLVTRAGESAGDRIGQVPADQRDEALSIDLWCTNGRLPTDLHPGDLGEDSPRCSNISRVTSPFLPPLDAGLHWRLVSHLTLSYVSLASPETLRGLLSVYDFGGDPAVTKRINGIERVGSTVESTILDGLPVRQVHTTITLTESAFTGPGDIYLFGCVLDQFLSQYVAANTCSRLTIKTLGGKSKSRTLEFQARPGEEVLL